MQMYNLAGTVRTLGVQSRTSLLITSPGVYKAFLGSACKGKGQRGNCSQ